MIDDEPQLSGQLKELLSVSWVLINYSRMGKNFVTVGWPDAPTLYGSDEIAKSLSTYHGEWISDRGQWIKVADDGQVVNIVRLATTTEALNGCFHYSHSLYNEEGYMP